ncbi:hypothetical protein CWI42_010680 [Ordospora colligata]|uniref:GOLD domain-containing protein n=1 Tax=Ordospora colligata OC4 TaxID=1354746 RepID=A0A0B2UN78_9MICR|nr:uncharacterized protein M896_010680 [Ordospora colligata OC4]KHN70415.1 hypothetical protein M896_010680 [Ordospora colligata OC4]TBU17165.1 hypothetical protein CWI41_010680 [Ordospora colligata]TBU17415.1 hypothetical protein CWI40_010680 [Ordospora colligata]TBU19595.1 hypothetical protein CWI42_010680 [Ordospora colligata]
MILLVSLIAMIQMASATLFRMDAGTSVESSQKLKGQTVVLMQTRLLHRSSFRHEWKEADGINAGVRLTIHKSDGDYEEADADQGNMVFKDLKHGVSNTFFYTTPETGYYTMVFSLDPGIKGEFALELFIFAGRAWTPSIVSGTDYQMEWLSKKMGDLLYFAKNNFDLQTLDDHDEMEYVDLYNNIFKLVNRVVLLKIFAISITLAYIDKKSRDFYVSKRIVKN